ncbi:bestrophin family ion channel [Chryseobacterium sp.]|uniref:bestrophin family protein n=1 Tax=Chryseobacterium sp. TaxID=1871047 RepID=UPI0025BD9944|nr:bestrophin family ion channel [Chryseobacterium sp.]MBV8325173.1 hypothetical protein [Chryseobacterium sp.]
MLLNTKIPVWGFIKRIKYDLITISLFSILIGLIANYGDYFAMIEIPIALVAIIGTAISLLLAFRISQSYNRWWEARIVWGSIVNNSRTLIRQVQEFLPETELEEIKGFAERQIIWNFALGESLRKVSVFSSKVQKYLEDYKIEAYHIPNALLIQHSQQLKRLAEADKITEYRQIQIDTTLLRLCNAMGKCERIKNTVFPAAYSMLIHFLIYIFTILLPFTFHYNMGFVNILLTAGIPMIFIAIEYTSILMQDPFENTPLDIPMTSLSKTIEANIKQQLNEKAEKPVPFPPNTYYMM